ncbi:cuticle protein 16.5-like [Spodoptera frugiperda]|uniref:Cuticle protein 16.5-like n=1 Tax=Spodoptera frugiperda TaxID=7108 RepID=A0A9R0DGS6_SPOFR|nr:cuticle protein 16.5-like [Spodoptera frugiperda]
MMKLIVVLAALVAISAAKPALVEAPLVAAAPAAVVTATSSQYFHRVNNGLAAYVASPAAYVASPAAYVASAAAPYVAAPYVASPYAASAPLVAV